MAVEVIVGVPIDSSMVRSLPDKKVADKGGDHHLIVLMRALMRSVAQGL